MPGSRSISILMSVRNGQRYLPEAIASIERQSFSDFECLVMDDGSTDGTEHLLRDWSSRNPKVRLFKHSESSGLTASLKELLSHAKGEYVARHDADDASLPERLRLQKKYLDSHPQVALVGCAYDLMDDQGRVFGQITPPSSPEALRRLLSHRNILAHGSWLCRRQAMERAGGYREFFEYSQDYDFLLRLSEQADIAALPETLYNLRMDDQSLSFAKRDKQKWYAKAAQECSRLRRSGQSEVPAHLLNQVPQATMAWGANHEKYELQLLKALHALKRGEVQQAQEHLRSVPFTYEVRKGFILRALCYLPRSLRNAVFSQPARRSFLG